MRKKTSLVQQTADKLYHMIVTEQRFQAGDRLPTEMELSEQFEISRSTLREAVRILCSQGILTVRRGSGTFVDEALPLANDPDFRGLRETHLRLHDLYEVRMIYEPYSTSVACLRATDEELDMICAQGEIVANCIRNHQDRTEEDQRFHQLIIAAAHNEFLLLLFPVIQQAISESIQRAKTNDQLSMDTLQDHKLIMDFIQERDSVGAKSAMEIHLLHNMRAQGIRLSEQKK